MTVFARPLLLLLMVAASSCGILPRTGGTEPGLGSHPRSHGHP